MGQVYGVLNKNSLLNSSQIQDLLSVAQNNGINHFDTAAAYGNSENLLGKKLEPKFNPEVSSKLNESDCLTLDQTIQTIQKILDRLQLTKLDVLYLHNDEPLALSYSQEVLTNLNLCREMGMFSRIGVSLYDKTNIIRIRDTYPEIKVFQVPENIADRRLLRSKELMDMKNNGYQIFVRSIFLQGILLCNENEIPSRLAGSQQTIRQIRNLARAEGITQLDVCLGYAKMIPWMTDIIIAPVSVEQLLQILKSAYILDPDLLSNIESLGPELADPRKW